MKLQSTTPALSTIPANGTDYNVCMSHKLFSIITDKIYTHKIAACVRELCANAYDSHVQAGVKDKPFRVGLPNDLHPFFEVEDYGLGMDADDVDSVYKVVFNSTKDQSDDYIGAMGLGSKSPHAYSETFNVICRKDGIERQYISSFVQGSIPRMDLLCEFPTVECNGVKIQIPVKESDFEEFKREVAWYCGFYPTRPTINKTGFDFIVKQDVIDSLNDKGYSFGQSFDWFATPGYVRYSDTYVVMGGVPYPVDMKNEFNEFVKLITSEKPKIFAKVNMGDISVSTSRESLSLDDKTKETIQSVIDKINSDLKQEVIGQVEQHTNTFEKIRFLMNEYGISRHRVILDLFPEFRSALVKLNKTKVGKLTAIATNVDTKRRKSTQELNLHPKIIIKDCRYVVQPSMLKKQFGAGWYYVIDQADLTDHYKHRLEQYFGIEPNYYSWEKIRDTWKPLRIPRDKTFKTKQKAEENQLVCHHIIFDFDNNHTKIADRVEMLDLSEYDKETTLFLSMSFDRDYIISGRGMFSKNGVYADRIRNTLSAINTDLLGGKYKHFVFVKETTQKKCQNLFSEYGFQTLYDIVQGCDKQKVDDFELCCVFIENLPSNMKGLDFDLTDYPIIKMFKEFQERHGTKSTHTLFFSYDHDRMSLFNKEFEKLTEKYKLYSKYGSYYGDQIEHMNLYIKMIDNMSN